MKQIFKDFKELLRDLRFYLMLFGIVLIILLAAPAWSTTPRAEADATASSGDLISKGDRSKAFAFGAGDVDISGCLAHYSILWGLWTNTRHDWLCIADRYDMVGEHERAAEARCFVRKNQRKYGAECVTKMTFDPPVVAAPVEVIETHDDEEHEEQQTYLGELEGRMAKLESDRNRPRTKVIKKTIQQPFLSDEKKAKLQAVLDE